jgi:2-methylisocitrate lyase-like PEP mutase family enzyme
MGTLAERRSTFRKLHETGCFLIPNPWDIGTARCLERLGFQAIATTSAGFAFSRGLADGQAAIPRDLMLAHLAGMAAAVDIPVNADFMSGFAHEPEAVAANVRLCVETGVAGLSIEDITGDPAHPHYDLPLAVERIRAARRAIDASGAGVLVTARTECYLTGHPEPFREALRRLEAFAAAGADVLYAPGLIARPEIEALVKAVAPKPVNVLVVKNVGLTVNDLAALGVRRVSVGSALSRAAWGGVLRAAEGFARGEFSGLDGAAPYADLNRFFA